MSKPQPKKINALDQDESAPQPASSVEVVVPSVEITPELEQEIKSAAEDEAARTPRTGLLASVALSRIVPPLPPAPAYTTAFYQSNGIPVCMSCGEKYRSDRSGLPLCPVDAVDCPRK